MNTQTAIPRPHRLTDQPTQWPLFYLLPRTYYVKRQRAANSPQYYPMPKAEVSDHNATSNMPPHENWLQAMLRRELEILQEAIADTWTAIKQAGRVAVKWLVWRIVFPLSVTSAIWIPAVSPMELPL